MKRSWILVIVVAANLATAVALAFLYPQLMVSPGRLVPAHGELGTDCFACHAPLLGASAERCVSCHAVADIGQRSTTGRALPPRTPVRAPFHQHLVARDCMACHSDHQASLIGQRSLMSFSHTLLQPAAQAASATCHTAPATILHRGTASGCAQCHGTEQWSPASFDHARFFVLEGEHNAPCATCHVNNVTSRYTCFGCHEHQPDSIRARHLREGIRDVQNCVSCHRSAHEDDGKGRNRRARD